VRRRSAAHGCLGRRVAFAAAAVAPSPDFDEAALIALEGWEKVVGYVEQAWQEHVLA
jgi:hypothetical protein